MGPMGKKTDPNVAPKSKVTRRRNTQAPKAARKRPLAQAAVNEFVADPVVTQEAVAPASVQMEAPAPVVPTAEPQPEPVVAEKQVVIVGNPAESYSRPRFSHAPWLGRSSIFTVRAIVSKVKQ